MVSFVSAEFKLKKILEILSNCSPEKSNASIVFSNVGFSGFWAMAFTSILAFFMASLNAGRKSSLRIFEKGAVLYKVWKFFNMIVFIFYIKCVKNKLYYVCIINFIYFCIKLVLESD